MPLSIGRVLSNRYRVVELIGQGGFGAVYRAWDTALDLHCAVKENLDTSPEAQRQFQREASILANLRHPNLTRVTDHFLIPGQGQYLVMDFVEGKSLEEVLTEQGQPLNEKEALSWVEQVCQALDYLHSQKPPVIHRDIKPQNVIITPDGRAVLVDFGISKVYDPVLSTTTGAQAVTPGYSPPEQYGQGRTDPRSDVYALGATLYTLLTGQPPPDAIERMVHETSLRPPRQANSRISPAVEKAILGALEVTTSRRFQTINQFQAALSKPAADAVAQPSPPSATPARPKPTPTQHRPAPARQETASRPRAGWGFGLVWAVANAVGFVAVWFLDTDLRLFPSLYGVFGDPVVVFPIYGAIMGIVLGIPQSFVLRWRVFRIGTRWIVASAFGWAIGLGIGRLMAPNLVLGAVITGTAIGIAQWLILRWQVWRAFWWILANAIVFSAVWLVRETGWGVTREAIAGLLFGAITGSVLVRLLRRPIP